jgi:predicted amidohydrolase
MKIALVQMNCEKAAIDRNLDLMRQAIADASAEDAAVVCFPEMCLTGYIDPAKYPQAILTLEHQAIKQLVELSGTHSICVIAGFVEHNSYGKPYITQFVASHGQMAGVYRKRTIKEGEEEWFAPGDGRQPIFDVGGVACGLAICADIDDPQIFGDNAALGAKVVFECAAPGLYGSQATRNWVTGHRWWRNNCLQKLGKYAAEQRIHIAVSTQAGRTIDEDFPGGGYLFDDKGQLVVETENWSEGVLYADIEV